MKKLCVLGVTGSIGQNVCKVSKNNFEIVSVALNNRIDLLENILKDSPSIKYIAIQDNEKANMFKKNHPNYIVFTGRNCLIDLIDVCEVDIVVNALVGFVGLEPTVHTLKKNLICALANKESLVVGGELINNLLKAGYGKLYPIDSEHVAIYKLLKEHSLQEVDEIIITASGGSFRDLKRDQLENVTVEQALKHPSWKMGSKITIDSATMMNKGFEIMEAYYLFHFPLEKIKVLLHDESVIHSLIKLVDHSYHADLGPADMCIPISYALYEGNYHNVDVKDLSLEDLATLHFRKYDNKRYPCVEFAKKALLIGGSMGCVLNASNEVANRLFRENKIKFLDIEKIIMKVMSLHQVEQNPTLDDLRRINDWAEKTALSIYRGE